MMRHCVLLSFSLFVLCYCLELNQEMKMRIYASKTGLKPQ